MKVGEQVRFLHKEADGPVYLKGEVVSMETEADGHLQHAAVCVHTKDAFGSHYRYYEITPDTVILPEKGLYGKYTIWNNDTGREVHGGYFVLKLTDPHARKAVETYAESCKEDNPELSADLMAWLRELRVSEVQS
jgi:hypothetical protein